MKAAIDASDDACRLCAHAVTTGVEGPDERGYRRCERCRLVFVERADLPDAEHEARHYRTHVNRPDDPRYRAFLHRLVAPLLVHLRPGMTVLDFGSGDGSPVNSLLAGSGVRVVEYDPVFRPDQGVLARRYDAVVASEVIEHFHEPARAFERLDCLLKPEGWLGIMTEPLEDGIDFKTWWYARDPTHVAFYARATFAWLGRHFGWVAEPASRTVMLFQKG